MYPSISKTLYLEGAFIETYDIFNKHMSKCLFFCVLLSNTLNLNLNFHLFLRYMGVDYHGKEFVHKAAIFVCVFVLLPRKRKKISHVRMFQGC